MAIRVVRLGTERLSDEGTRLGTVRRPPRGVTRADQAKKNYYDVWLPTLAPSAGLVKLARSTATPGAWARFVKCYEREMAKPDASAVLNALAALSHGANFSVGCYCAEELRCHRSILRRLLVARGAAVR